MQRTQKWDGSEVCPTDIVRTIAGQGPSGDVWTDWQLHCSRSYIVSGGVVDNPLVAPQVNRFQYAIQTTGGILGSWGGGPGCPGLKRCVEGAKARAVSNDERVVAYSDLVGVSQVINTNRVPRAPAIADRAQSPGGTPVHPATREPDTTPGTREERIE